MSLFKYQNCQEGNLTKIQKHLYFLIFFCLVSIDCNFWSIERGDATATTPGANKPGLIHGKSKCSDRSVTSRPFRTLWQTDRQKDGLIEKLFYISATKMVQPFIFIWNKKRDDRITKLADFASKQDEWKPIFCHDLLLNLCFVRISLLFLLLHLSTYNIHTAPLLLIHRLFQLLKDTPVPSIVSVVERRVKIFS